MVSHAAPGLAARRLAATVWPHKALEGLLDFDRARMSAEIYSDELLYELELERIFKRSWLFLCHENQLSQPGSFVQAYMAEDPIIVVRQRDGSIAAFLNQCQHRGMRLCRGDQGRTKSFRCSYHGWVYDIAGKLVTVPFEKEAYKNKIDKSQWSLRRVPRIESYRGLYFGNWDESAPSLVDYLGAGRWMLDVIFGRNEAGAEFVPGCFRWTIDCNWKVFAEQHSWDMYHVGMTHRSADLAFDQLERQMEGSQYADPRMGHSGGFYEGKMPLQVEFEKKRAELDPPHIATWRRKMHEEATRLLGEPRASQLNGGHMCMFPNTAALNGPNTLRIIQPRGPHKMELWTFGVTLADAPDEIKRGDLVWNEQTFGPAGLVEQDDGENLLELQNVLRGTVARETKFSIEMGLGEARSDATHSGGIKSYLFTEEGARNFYKSWMRFMTEKSWEEMGFSAARRAAE
jgi:phenylpropionate dioxygenase-like ring-hydroxylating dioxygenase large terminal subunit